MKKHYTSRLLRLLLLPIIFLSPLTAIVQAQTPAVDCGTIPNLVVEQTVPVTSTYSVWVLAKTESASARPYVRVDSGQCRELNLPTGTDWQWVRERAGGTHTLQSGIRNFALSVSGGAVLMDKILVTNDTSCTPTGDGSNCVEDVLNFIIEGIEQNQNVTSTATVQASLTSRTTQAVTMDFYIDGTRIASQTAAPYCLTVNQGRCAAYDFSRLPLGQHTIRVVGRINDQADVERSVTFNRVSSTPAPTPPAPTPSSQKLTVSVSGIVANDTVSGNRVIQATVSGTTKPVSVKFKVNSQEIRTVNAAPYCMVSGSNGTCGQWDTTSFQNGTYTMYVVASAEGFDDQWVTLPITVNNASTSREVLSKKQEVVIGKPNQVASGTTTVTLPKNRNTEGSVVQYKINGQVVATSLGFQPKANISLAKVSNGKQVLSATITRPSGEQETISSTITVKNNIFTATNNFLRGNRVALVAAAIVASVVVFYGTHFAVSQLKKRRFNKKHNLDKSYTYETPKQELVLKTQLMHGFAAVAVLLLGVTVIGRLGQVSAATGIGFIEDVENAKTIAAEFSQDDENMSRLFIRLAFESPTAPAPIPPTPPATTPPPATPANCGTITQWRAEYFANAELGGSPGVCRNEAAIDYDWAFGVPVAGIPGDNFSVRWTRSFNFTAGTYNFAAWADDGVRVFVDGTRIIDSWGPNWGTTRNASRALTAGSHTIVMEYQELGGDASARFSWTSSNGSTSPTAPAPTAPAPTAPAPTAPAPTAPAPTAPLPSGTTQHNGMGPAINNALIPPARRGSSSVTMASGAPITSLQGEGGAFRHRCDYSHMNYDDPILYPNQTNRAHLHTFFGNTGTNAFSTPSSLRNGGNSTCLGGIFNRSAYWVPALITSNGTPVVPFHAGQYTSDLEIYYKLGYQGISSQAVRAFPNGLQMIAGNSATATTPDGTKAGFWCEVNNVRSTRTAGIQNCPQNSTLTMYIEFPQCWDGRNLTSANGRSHMAYGGWGEGCPSTHPVGLPFVQYFVRHLVTDPAGSGAWRLSSDHYSGGQGGYSLHADYIFAWDESAFTTVVNRCYRPLFDCHYELGDGRIPVWTRERQ